MMTIVNRRVLSTALVTFVVTLLVMIPMVFVWNLFRHGEGTFDLPASIGIAVTLALVFPAVMVVRGLRHSH
jgi:hypothetical protein